MQGYRYKKRGWYGESHRHYLARKGVKTAKRVVTQRADLTVKVDKPKPEPAVLVHIVDTPQPKDKDFLVVVRTKGTGPRKTIRIPHDQVVFAKAKLRALGAEIKSDASAVGRVAQRLPEDAKLMEQNLAKAVKDVGGKAVELEQVGLKKFKQFRKEQFVKQSAEAEEAIKKMRAEEKALQEQQESFREERRDLEARERERLQELVENP